MSSDVYESFINTIRAEAWDEGHSQALANVAWPKERKGNPYRKEEAHTPHRSIETSPGGVGFARRKGWLADPTPNPYQKEQTDE